MNGRELGVPRSLCVLVAFQSDIAAYLDDADLSSVAQSSRWLRMGRRRVHASSTVSLPADDELSSLSQLLHTRLGRHRRKGHKFRLSISQVEVLLRDLLLVTSGLRPSCLVDCCALSKELAELLLSSLSTELPDSRHYAVGRLRVLLLDSNVFFVNVDAFVREKLQVLATGSLQQLYVDVSASLTNPQLVDCKARLEAYDSWAVKLCSDLLAVQSLVVECPRPATLNATALAGILLCYECVYDVYNDSNNTVDVWTGQENCLAMCPLLVVQTSIESIPLQEFSVPQQLLSRERLKVLRVRCLNKLQRAIARSSFTAQAQVKVAVRTLPRVAL